MATGWQVGVNVINFYPDSKTFRITLGLKDVGIAQCDNGPDYPGVAFIELDRPYEKDEKLPDSDNNYDDTFKVIFSIFTEAGYASLYRAVTQLGERTGYGAKRTLGDNLMDNLMDEIGDLKLKLLKAEYDLKQALEKRPPDAKDGSP